MLFLYNIEAIKFLGTGMLNTVSPPREHYEQISVNI